MCIMRARRRISAQRGLNIRGLKRERRKWAGKWEYILEASPKEVSTLVTDLDDMPDILTISELQEVLRVGRSTAYRLISSSEIQSIRIGKSIRIPKKYVKEFLEQQNISDAYKAHE